MEHKKLITINDIWRGIGILMILAGQFLPRFKFTGYSVDVETNEVIIAGICIVVVIPIINRWLTSKKKEES